MAEIRPVIDADSHKCENPLIFAAYVDREYRDRLTFVRDKYGEQRFQIDDRRPGSTEPLRRLFLQPDGYGKGTFRPYHDESTMGGLFNRLRLEHMDREGIDAQVIYGSVAMAFNSIIDRDLAVALCRAYNDYIAEDCSTNPRRLHPAAVLPLQDPSAALEEMRRCVCDLGMPTVMIPPNVPQPHPSAPDAFPDIRVPKPLSHPDFFPLYEEAERLDIALGVHGAPGIYLAGGASDQLTSFTLVHVFANRAMQQMALAALIFDGVLERFPRLRVAALEAGCGWAPDFIENLHEHWEKRIVNFDPSIEPNPASFLAEVAREGAGRGTTELLRRARGLMSILFASREKRLGSAELRKFQYEHPELQRDPREYFDRGQIYLTCSPSDPAITYLPAAMGPVGERIVCWSVDYGHWDAELKGCVRAVTERRDVSEGLARRLLSSNALLLYGPRLEARLGVAAATSSPEVDRPAVGH